MKKMISCLVVACMVISLFGIVYADGVPTFTQSITTDIQVRLSSDASWVQNISTSASALPSFTARSILNMADVRNKVGALAGTRLNTFNELKTNGVVQADITVVITFPNHVNFNIDDSEKLIPDFSYAMVADSNNPTDIDTIFIEDKSTRSFSGNQLTLTLATNRINLGVLDTNKNKYLDDIILDATNLNFAVPDFGTPYTISGTMTCTAKIYDTDTATTPWRTYIFNASDSANVLVNYDSESSPGSGMTGGKPPFTPSGDGDNFSKVTILPETDISNGKIYYTTDGSIPTVDKDGHLEGTTKVYTGEFFLENNERVTAVIIYPGGTRTDELNIDIDKINIKPNFPSSTVKYGQEITLESSDGKTIYYTTDGSAPTFDSRGNPTGSTKKYTDPIVLTEDTVLRVAAVRKDGKILYEYDFEYTVAPFLSDKDNAYIQGDDLGLFNPENPITRAEIATIFARLTLGTMEIEGNYETTFTDVFRDDWYHNAIALMEDLKIVNGYEDGTFRPNAYITRAEYAKIASMYDSLGDINKKVFSDVSTFHWAFVNINSAADKGWVNGYEDGTFKPDNFIKRCEAVTVINRVLGQDAKAKYKDADFSQLIIFPDAATPESHWAFYDIVESSNIYVK